MSIDTYVCKDCGGRQTIYFQYLIYLFICYRKLIDQFQILKFLHLKKCNVNGQFRRIYLCQLYSMSPCFRLVESVGNENYLYTVLCQTKVHQRDYFLWNLNSMVTDPSFESFLIYRCHDLIWRFLALILREVKFWCIC